MAGVEAARRVVDLRAHDGCIRASAPPTSCRSCRWTRGDVGQRGGGRAAVARRVGEELELPVFLYGSLAGGLRPAFFRRGGPDGLQRRIDAGELSPAHGPVAARSARRRRARRRPCAAARLQPRAQRVARGGARRSRRRCANRPAACRASRRSVCELPDGDGAGVDERRRSRRHAAARDGAANRGGGRGAGRARRSRRARRAAPGLPCVAAAASAAGVRSPARRGRPADAEAALDAAARALRLERLDADRVLEWHLHG